MAANDPDWLHDHKLFPRPHSLQPASSLFAPSFSFHPAFSSLSVICLSFFSSSPLSPSHPHVLTFAGIPFWFWCPLLAHAALFMLPKDVTTGKRDTILCLPCVWVSWVRGGDNHHHPHDHHVRLMVRVRCSTQGTRRVWLFSRSYQRIWMMYLLHPINHPSHGSHEFSVPALHFIALTRGKACMHLVLHVSFPLFVLNVSCRKDRSTNTSSQKCHIQWESS